MLTAIPKSLFSWDFEIRDGDTLLGQLSSSWFSENGSFESGGITWKLGRESWFHGIFFLKHGERKLAAAEKSSAFYRSFQVTFDHEHFTWQAETALNRAFVLRKGSHVIGSMRPKSMFTREASIELPEELSLERKVFLAWLAILLWRRAHNSS